MHTIAIRKNGVTELDTDVIVNAANTGSQAGGSICSAIFKVAGHIELQKACGQTDHCDVSFSMDAPEFKLEVKCAVHAVGQV